MNRIVYVGKHTLTFSVSRHMHTTWELIYCTGGSGTLTFDDQSTLEYSAGDVAVIPPGLPHSNRSAKGFTNIHINLADTTLADAEPFLLPADPNGFLLNAFQAAFYYYSGADADDAMLLSMYGQLVAAFASSRQPGNPRSEVVHEIKNHILQNYPDCNYDLNAYLHTLPFNSEYVKKLFKKETGMTPLQYLTDKRLENGANALAMCAGKGNISETAHLCGFSEPLYFSRLFKKKYGVSPRQYRPERPEPMTDSDWMKVIPL